MPIVRVQRIVGTVAVNDLREQTVGTLVFGGATTVVLAASAFTTAGTYSIFKYTTFAGGQAALDANVTFTPPAGFTVVDTHGTDTGSRVTVTLI
jgi:subtilase family serine protease